MQTLIFKKFRKFGQHLVQAFSLFQKNDPLRLAGATAFFANFAMPPILLILIRLFGFFVNRKELAQQIFERLANILDPSSTGQIKDVLRNIRGLDRNWFATALSFIFFLFVATTLFNVIKNSMEQIWKIGQEEKLGIFFTLKLRAHSFIIILLAGLLFFIGLVADSVQAFVTTYVNHKAPTFGRGLGMALNQLAFIAIVSAWFCVLFRFLTNARPSWLAAAKGGILTGILFTLGKFILRIMLPLSNIGNIYGASGSIVLIMLFVFYSSFIFYFGTCYVRIISDAHQEEIRPKKGSFLYELTEVVKEKGND